MPNRLSHETSPYLLQHAHNPVDWFPWGPQALARAKAEERPIFLSIGYAACHWCHVMERESFEDAATAAFLNEHFVSIKVDREERPELDAIYMDAVQAMTGQGGWPMSVFLTPDGRPFYGGTYFPNRAVHGMPAFRDVLEGVLRAWREDRAGVETAAAQLVEAIDVANRASAVAPERQAPASAAPGGLVGPDGRPLVRPAAGPPPLDARALDQAMIGLERTFDARNGGWGGAPKFPAPMIVELLLRLHLRSGDGRPLAMARRTLDAMAAGGIYDHLGGGFARYATDEHWLVPHFEKMLYDNAQLARVYLHAWQVTAEPRYREVVEETLDYVLREMTVEGGGFATSQDADTEGREGATYIWRASEVAALLGEHTRLFADAYGVTEAGNWEGVTILSRVVDDATLAGRHGLAVAEVATRLAEARARLLDARSQRPQPARDDKVLAAWNGLMLAPVAEASRALGRADYRDAAERAAGFVLAHLRDADGRLLRSWKDGRAQHLGVLEDHAFLAEGLISLYEATFEGRWFEAARELLDVVLGRFADPAGGFFDTGDDHEQLITRPKGLQDNALPSGGAMAATGLLRLAALSGEGRYRAAAEEALRGVLPVLGRYPTAFGQWLAALELATSTITEVAIVGTPGETATDALLAVVGERWRPHLVLAAGDGSANAAVPLLRDRPDLDGRPAAYVCRDFACRRPVATPDELRAELAAAGS
ncbi:MAG TPA: thioredoxin domain-containing protein [Candidatus Limnocylindrales bacterium]|nr:thioredoxin domain-containing protein [Candidatus Limnocylindrales bacterium]